MPKKGRPGPGVGVAATPHSPAKPAAPKPAARWPLPPAWGAAAAAVLSVALGTFLLWSPTDLLPHRHPYPARLLSREDETYTEVQDLCGDYLEASISRRGFSHVPIPNYRLPLHGPFSVDSFSLQPSAPSLLVLPNSDVLVVFRLTNAPPCPANASAPWPPPPPLPPRRVTRVGAAVLTPALRLRTAAHVVGGLDYDALRCEGPAGKAWTGADEPAVFAFQGEPWLLLAKPLQDATAAADARRCRPQYALCPLRLGGPQIACQAGRMVTLRLPKEPEADEDALHLADHSPQRTWSPFEQNGKLYISRRLEPHTVLQVSVTTGATKQVHQSSNAALAGLRCRRRPAAGKARRWAVESGSPAVPFQWNGKPRLLAVGRHVGLDQSFSFFYMTRPPKGGVEGFPLAEVSREFCLADADGRCERQQAVGGVAVQDNRLLLAYDANGCEARLALLPRKDYAGLYLQY